MRRADVVPVTKVMENNYATQVILWDTAKCMTHIAWPTSFTVRNDIHLRAPLIKNKRIFEV